MVSDKIHWATFLNTKEDEKLQRFASFLYENGEIEGRSRYATVKYMLTIGHDILYDERLTTMRDTLYKNKAIKKKSLYDAFHYILLYATNKIKEEME